MKTGPYKPAPHIPQGFYIAAEDRDKFMKALAAGHRVDLATDVALSKELPSNEEETIKAFANLMDSSAKLPTYPDAETLDAQVSANLLR